LLCTVVILFSFLLPSGKGLPGARPGRPSLALYLFSFFLGLMSSCLGSGLSFFFRHYLTSGEFPFFLMILLEKESPFSSRAFSLQEFIVLFHCTSPVPPLYKRFTNVKALFYGWDNFFRH